MCVPEYVFLFVSCVTVYVSVCVTCLPVLIKFASVHLSVCVCLYCVCVGVTVSVSVLQYRMEPGQVVQETVTVEEDPHEVPPVISVETSEDGTTRRTETTVLPLPSLSPDSCHLLRV